MPTDLTIYCDGATDGSNPGPSAVGILILGADGGVVREVSERLDGVHTNNEAEYRALLRALWHARDLVADSVIIRSDSQLIVNQVGGRWAVNEQRLAPLCERARRCVKAFPYCQLEWVPREQNARADELAGNALGRVVTRDWTADSYRRLRRDLELARRDLSVALADNRALEAANATLQQRLAALEQKHSLGQKY